MKNIMVNLLMLSALVLFSCESEQAKKERLAREEQQRIEWEQQKEEEKKAERDSLKNKPKKNQKKEKKKKKEAARLEMEAKRLEREAKLEQESKEQAIRDKYINNSLSTGAAPYARYYGRNSSCNGSGCSKISVTTSNSDVLVTIKNKSEKVARHAFIQAGDSYTFSFPNGTYQTFFYYGKGWNPEKEMKNGKIKGGFVSNEQFGKDAPQYLSNNILEYRLILQRNGNFSTRPSDPEEAL